MTKHELKLMSELRIGQVVTVKSYDAGVPDQQRTIWGLTVSSKGMINICVGDADGTNQEDCYHIADISNVTTGDRDNGNA